MLNPAAPVPLYRQLADQLAELIRSGRLAPGDRLPSEPALARAHQLGRPTVRQATDLLVRRGLVQRRRGSGTFVQRPLPSVDVFSLSGTVSSFESRGLELETRLLEAARRVAVHGDEQNPFHGKEAFRYVRLGKLDGQPVLVEHVFLSPSVFADFEQLEFEGASLAELVRERYHLSPQRGLQTFETGRGPSATRRALGLGSSECALVIRRTLDFPEAPSALHSILYCRTDRVRFSQTLGASNLEGDP